MTRNAVAKGFMHAVTDGIKRYNKEYAALVQ